MSRKLVALLLLFSSTSPASATDPIRRDRYDDPLPDGALARLGTTRFRPAPSWRRHAFSADGKMFATSDDAVITIWDMNNGKELRSCKLPKPYLCDQLFFSPDGKRLVAIGWKREGTRPLSTQNQLFLLDPATGKSVLQFGRPQMSLKCDECGFILDGKKFLALDNLAWIEANERQGFGREVPRPGQPQQGESFGAMPIIWDLETGKEVAELPGGLTSALTSDGAALAIARGNTIRVCDLAATRVAAEFKCGKSQLDRLCWSADGKVLGACRQDLLPPDNGWPPKDHPSNLVFWNVAAKKELPSWNLSAFRFALSPDGCHVAALDWWYRLHIREIKTGKELNGEWLLDNCLLRLNPIERSGYDCQLHFAPDGTLLVRDKVRGFRNIDIQTGRILRRATEDLAFWTELQVLADGKTIVNDWPFGVQDLATGKDRASFGHHRGRITSMKLGRKEPVLLSQDEHGALRVWDLITGDLLPSPFSRNGLAALENGFGFLDDGKTVMAVGKDLIVRVWEARTGKIIRQFGIGDFQTWLSWESPYHHYLVNKENWLSFSADYRRLAIAAKDQVAIWDIDTGQRLRCFAYPGKEMNGVNDGFPCNPSIQLASDGNTVMVQMSGHSWVQTIKDARRWESEGCLSPNGQSLAAFSDNSFTLRNLRTGVERVSSIPKSEDTEYCPTFTADNLQVATFLFNCTVILRDAVNGKEVCRIPRPHENENDFWNAVEIPFRGQTGGNSIDRKEAVFRLYTVQFGRLPPEYESDRRFICSQDGRLFAFARYGTVTLVETRTGKQISTFEAPARGHIGCLLFARDSRTLITGREDSTILLWDWANASKLKADPQTLPDESTWDALANDDAGKAYRAIFNLAGHPDEAIRLLRSRLKQTSKDEADHIRNWIKKLDDQRFTVRDQAAKNLLGMGEAAVSYLQQASSRSQSAEVENRIQRLLNAPEMRRPGREAMRQLRAVQALEWINTPESREYLKELAEGEPGTFFSKEAEGALKR